MGIYVSMFEATKAMRDIAREGGFITDSNGQEYRKIQLLTAEEILVGKKHPHMPGQNVTPESARPGPRKGETLSFQFAKSRAALAKTSPSEAPKKQTKARGSK